MNVTVGGRTQAQDIRNACEPKGGGSWRTSESQRRNVLRFAALATLISAPLFYLTNSGTVMQWLVIIVPVALALGAWPLLAKVHFKGRRVAVRGHPNRCRDRLDCSRHTGLPVDSPYAVSILATLQVVFDPYGDVAKAYLLFVMCLACFALTESFGFMATRRTFTKFPLEEPRTYLALMVLGLAATIAFHGSAHSQAVLLARGQTRGLGFQTVLADCLPTGIALGVISRHWNNRWFVILSIVGLSSFW